MPSQADVSFESTDTTIDVDTSGDSLLLGELVVDEEMVEGGGGREREKDGDGEKAKERRKPPVTKR